LIKHTFEIAPVEQVRPRAARMRNNNRIVLYDVPKVKLFKQTIGVEASLSYRQPPLKGALKVSIAFYRPINKSASKKQSLLQASKQALPVVKPDLDNYIKSFIDALHGIYWDDDNQICHIDARKFYSVTPRIEIMVEQISEDKL